MSTFVIVDQKLYADSLQLILLPRVYEHIKSKIHVSPDREFAFCCSGNDVDAKKDHLTVVFRRLLERMITDRHDSVMISDLLGKPLIDIVGYDFTFLLATKNQSFATCGRVDAKKDRRIVNVTGYSVAVGSSANTLNGLLTTGMSPEEAYVIVNRYDTATGSDPEIFDLSELDDFTIRGTTASDIQFTKSVLEV